MITTNHLISLVLVLDFLSNYNRAVFYKFKLQVSQQLMNKILIEHILTLKSGFIFQKLISNLQESK